MEQRQLTFVEAVKTVLLENYCNFNGRASRSEYWWYALFAGLLSVIVTLVFESDTISGLLSLALLLPGLGVCVRRLHDIGKSGWLVLLALIPLIGAIILIVWYVKPSDPYTNEYGEEPYVEY